jgi:sulfite exporter TauE/SafE
MNELSFLSAFAIGIAGGVHCFGMCGGITLAMRTASPPTQPHFPFALSYHLGRITSYTLAGAITGFFGSMVSTSSTAVSSSLQWFSIVMLVLMALYVGQWFRGLVVLEKAGHTIWKLIRPLSTRFIPFKTPLHALPYGFIWGWLPCGLVYSTLTWSLASCSALDGALIMFAFGLGTLPNMLLASMAASHISALFKHKLTRQLVAVLLLLLAGTLMLKRFV